MLLFGACCNSLACVCLAVSSMADGDDFTLLCLAPATPSAPSFCPDGTTFSPDVTTPEIGECRHACHAPDAWEPEHFCYSMVSTNTFDWGNNTCGIGDCDSHTTRSACEGGEGHWDIEDSLSEQPCSSIQALTSYIAYVHPDDAFFVAIEHLAKVGETCCDGFDAEAFMQCTSDDASIFVRPEMHHSHQYTACVYCADASC